MMKRIGSVLLALIMALSMLPTAALAAENAVVAEVGGESYTDLQEALKAISAENNTLELLRSVTINEDWDNRYTGAKITVPVVINGNDNTLTFTGTILDGYNWLSAFRFEADAEVNDLTIDMSQAISGWNNRLRAISAKADLSVNNCTFIGNTAYTNTNAIIFGEGAGSAVGQVAVSVSGSDFIDWKNGVSDNQNAQDVNSVTITGNSFTGANVNVSAANEVVFSNNIMNEGGVRITSYTAASMLAVVADGNVLDEDAVNAVTNAAVVTVQEGISGMVAKIDQTGYGSVQAAVTAAQDGDTITLLGDCAEDVTVPQTADVKITINGAGNKMTGSITVDGKSGTDNDTAAVTIQNVNFIATGIATDACINLGVSGNNNTRYVKNVTVQDCTFTGVDQAKVAIKSYTGGDKNLTITGCTVDNTMHSLLQVDNVNGLIIDDCTVNSKNGINLNSSSNVVISNSVIDVSGYAVRIGVSGGASGMVALVGNTLKTDNSEEDPAIILRGTAPALVTLRMTENVVSGDVHIQGTTENTNISAEANYWDGKIAPVVKDGSYAISPDTYYYDVELEEPALAAGYTVDFEIDGGNVAQQQGVAYRATADEPEIPALAGHTFSGWYTDQTFSGEVVDLATYQITGATTFYGKWDINDYTVSFETGCTDVTVEDQQVTYGEKADEPEIPARAGHTFAGWFTTDTFAEAFDFDTYVITDDTTVYGKWDINDYTVSFDTEVTVIGQQVTYGEKAVKPADPVRGGYAFGGWYADAACTVPFDFDAAIVDHVTVYAKWIWVAGSYTPPNIYVPSGGSTSGGNSSGEEPKEEEPAKPSVTVTTDDNGNKVTTTVDPETGSKTQVVEATNGVTATTATGADGESETTVVIPESAVTGSEPVALPVGGKAPVTVTIPESVGTVEIEIPVENVTPGTVAVIVNADGTEEVLTDTKLGEDSVTVTLEEGATLKVVDNGKSFADTDDHWSEDAVAYVTARGMFAGTGTGSTFSPEVKMTRAMLAQAIYNLEGAEDHDHDANFTDIDSDAWYSKAVNWAAKEGIVSGYGDNSYQPDKPLTREEVVQIFFNYAKSKGYDMSHSADLSSFVDGHNVSDWAKAAKQWAVGAGLISGKGGNILDAKGGATRGEGAQMFMNFWQNIAQ